jgi:predicted PurR-regulated permease PerM
LGQIILSLAIFLLTFVGLSILGVKYALFLALIAGLFEVLPYLGPVLSAVPAILVALIQDPPLAGAVIILYIVIQKTEGYVLVPKIMQRTIGTSPLVVLLSLLIGFKLAGVLGLLLAVPLVGAIMVVIQEFTGTPALNEEV